MMQVSHGYHVVEDQSFSSTGSDHEPESDSVVVQREQIDDLESWFFGVFDPQVGDDVTKYVRSHLFDRNPKEVTFLYMRCFSSLDYEAQVLVLEC
jgi:protein phosphatase PTC1